MAALKVTYKDPHQLKPRAGNPRTHDRLPLSDPGGMLD